MKATLNRMDLMYEMVFSEPSFDLAEQGLALLKSLYAKLSAVSPIAATDMQMFGGNTLSEICARISMFNGSAKVEVTTEKCSVSFFNLENDSHLSICKECISLAEQAIRDTLPDLKFGLAAIRPTLSLELNDGTGDASSYLANIRYSGNLSGLEDFDGATLHHGISLEIENEEKGWNVLLNISRNHTGKSSLVVSCNALYNEQKTFQGLEHQTEHLKHLINTLLGKIDLEVSGFYLEES